MLSIEGGKAPQRLVGGKHQIYIEEWVRERERERGETGDEERGRKCGGERGNGKGGEGGE